jgi:hypothetical protein
MQESGMNIQVFNSPKYIMCGITAPMKLLELQADAENYRLQLRGEIDPGSDEFWNREINGRNVELDEERTIYTQDQANVILENLYQAGKISPIDLGVYTEFENEYVFSRRVHALERIADRVPVYNRYIPYAEFSSQPNLRYLYNSYASARGPTLFRPKDRLYLTKALLDGHFDFDMLSVDGVVKTCLALHSGNTGEAVTIEMLLIRWVFFWRGPANEVGSPMVSDDAYDPSVPVAFYWRPFSQPLVDIRDYFGEKIALYYAWIGFYTYYLMYVAVMGLALQIAFVARGYTSSEDHLDWTVLTFVLCCVFWNVAYNEGWNKEVAVAAVRWGTNGLEQSEKMRPQFKGDEEQPLKRSEITNIIETYYPEEKRNLQITWSYIMLCTLISLNVCLIAAIYYAEALVVTDYTEYDFSGFSLVVNIVQALQIVASSYVFDALGRWMNDKENYRTETDHEDALIAKTILFQLVNNFGVPMFTAVGKGPLLDSCTYTCLGDLQQLLYVIVIVRVVSNFSRPIYEVVSSLFGKRDETSGSLNSKTAQQTRDEELAELSSVKSFEEEIQRMSYPGTFYLYSQAVIQYGYISFFANAVPLLGLISLVENMVLIRLEAYTLCALTQRPHVLLAEDEGMWGNLMDIFSVLGAVSACAIICFTLDDFDEDTYMLRGMIFVAMFQLLLTVKYVFHYFLEPNMSLVEDQTARHKFVVEKYRSVVEDTGGSDIIGSRGHISVSLPSDYLYDLRKSKAWEEKDYKELEEKETTKKDLMREMRVIKDKLQAVYKYETYNENTGIGETKHGLPLGRLSVRIIELQEFRHEYMPRFASGLPLKVRILVKGSRNIGTQAGPAWTPKADTETHKLDGDHKAVFNQVMGPFAPIRTQDAEVVFEIMEVIKSGKGKSVSSVAVASKRMRELLDQKTHNEVLNVQMRHDDGTLFPCSARLFVTLEFTFSKIVPLRNELYQLQDKIRVVDEGIQRIHDRKN